MAFPALNTLDVRRTNLPIQPTALIGREQEVAAVGALLRQLDVRLLTLTGPGGIGESVSARQANCAVARQLRASDRCCTVGSELLETAPQLKVLVTSRERLHLRGEKEIVVTPLIRIEFTRGDRQGALRQ